MCQALECLSIHDSELLIRSRGQSVSVKPIGESTVLQSLLQTWNLVHFIKSVGRKLLEWARVNSIDLSVVEQCSHTSLVSHKGYENNTCFCLDKKCLRCTGKLLTSVLKNLLSIGLILFLDARSVRPDFNGEIVSLHEQSTNAVIENCQRNWHQCCPSVHQLY